MNLAAIVAGLLNQDGPVAHLRRAPELLPFPEPIQREAECGYISLATLFGRNSLLLCRTVLRPIAGFHATLVGGRHGVNAAPPFREVRGELVGGNALQQRLSQDIRISV